MLTERVQQSCPAIALAIAGICRATLRAFVQLGPAAMSHFSSHADVIDQSDSNMTVSKLEYVPRNLIEEVSTL